MLKFTTDGIETEAVDLMRLAAETGTREAPYLDFRCHVRPEKSHNNYVND